jgi:2-oxoglutarate ferredoxin oxidoreductase subunit gamma
MPFTYSIRFSGAGGQGLVQAARMLAEAAAIYDNKNAMETFSYGPEARGSSCRAEIIVSDEVIEYPKTESVDFLLALTQEAYDKYATGLLPNAFVVVDAHVTIRHDNKGIKVLSIPLMDIAEKDCGKPSMVNIVALGFFAGTNHIIDKQSIRHAILARIPKRSEEMYIRAFEAGLEAAERQLGSGANRPI